MHPADTRSAEQRGVLLAVPWDQSYGGVNTVVSGLARYLNEVGRDVLFLFPGDHSAPSAGVSRHGFPSVRMNLRPPIVRRRPFISTAGFALTAPFALRHLVRLVRRRGIDVVNVHYPDENAIYFVALKHLTGVRLVTSVHGADITSLAAGSVAHRSMALLLRQSDAIVAPSGAFANHVRESFPSVTDGIITIHNGVDGDSLRKLAEGPNEAAPGGAYGGGPYCVCVAMFNAKKAHDTLLRAFAGVPAPMRLILVGDGPLRPNIVRLIADLGLADRVVLTGQQPPTVVAPLLAGSICSVLPSRNEPFGIAAVESMFLGTPVVSSDAQGLAEVVEHERTGLTFLIDDVPALTAALNRLLGDPQLRARLAEAALTHAEANFDWRRAASRYVATAYASTTPRAPAATRA